MKCQLGKLQAWSIIIGVLLYWRTILQLCNSPYQSLNRAPMPEWDFSLVTHNEKAKKKMLKKAERNAFSLFQLKKEPQGLVTEPHTRTVDPSGLQIQDWESRHLKRRSSSYRYRQSLHLTYVDLLEITPIQYER